MSVAIDVRPYVSLDAEAEILRGSGGRPELRPARGIKAEARWLSGLARLLGKADSVRVTLHLEREKPRRSLQANSYLWAVAYPVLLDGLRQIALDAGEECPVRSVEHLHEICKATFLPAVELPGGLKDRPTTTTLDTSAFARYVDAIVRYGAERGIWVPPATHEGIA